MILLCLFVEQMFVEQVMELVELNPIRDALVGLPGVDGLSTEQRKRLTIAVELVANPSIIFMDEPTSGLDARAAAIVMRTVRNTVDTGRTIVCTIHQPSIDIFEAFDEVRSNFDILPFTFVNFINILCINSLRISTHFAAVNTNETRWTIGLCRTSRSPFPQAHRILGSEYFSNDAFFIFISYKLEG